MVCHVVQQLVHEPKRQKNIYHKVLITICHVKLTKKSPGEKKKLKERLALKPAKEQEAC